MSAETPASPAEASRRLESVVRLGTVEAVDYPAARARVKSGGLLTTWLPWAGLAAGEVRHWRPPSVGEQVLVLSPSGSPESGVIVAGLYVDQHKHANDNRQETVAWLMPDETLIEYDWRQHLMTLYNAGDLQILIKGHASIRCDGNAIVNIGGSADIQIAGQGQLVAEGEMLVKSNSKLVLKGPSRKMVL